MGKAIVVQDCTVEVNDGTVLPPTGSFVIYDTATPPDSNVQVNSKSCYFGNVQVVIPSGSTGSAGALKTAVTVTITATGSNMSTSKGIALLEGDASSGLDEGTFVQGSTETPVTLTAVIKSAGQSDVTLD